MNGSWDAAEAVDIGLGQRLVPSVHGDQTLALAYAGFGTRHVVILADGAAGFVPTRLAAEVAVAAALGRIRSSALPDVRQVVTEAIGEAHHAVRRALIGTAAESEGGASILVVVLEASGVLAARVGRGRLYVVGKDRRGGARVLLSAGSEAVLGRLGPLATIDMIEAPLTFGDRLVMLSESALRPLAADLAQLVVGQPAQLAAQRVADAARRRGEADAIGCAVLEWNMDTPRAAHPSLGRIDPDAGRESPLAGSGRAHHQARRPSGGPGGMVIWFLAAALLGVGAALIVHAPPDAESERTRVRAPDPGTEAADAAVAALADAYALPEPGGADAEFAYEAGPLDGDDGLAEVFGSASDAATLARAIRRHVIARYPAEGETVFQRLDLRVRAAHDRTQVVQALVILARDVDLPRTARWAAETLPLLYR